jgi:hypothetical protein
VGRSFPSGERYSAASELHSLERYEKSWLLGLALDERGNVWSVSAPALDWAR